MMFERYPTRDDSELSCGGLVRVQESGFPIRADGSRVNRLERFHVELFKGFAARHPCIGARSVAPIGNLHLSIQADMDSVRAAYCTLSDLELYYRLSDDLDSAIKTLAIVFSGASVSSQPDFERRYWGFVQLLHDIDALFYPYDPAASPDPASNNFELSLVSRAVFTTTLNPHSPRVARRYPYPVFVMNQLAQFESLRKQGKFTIWQHAIRHEDALIDPSHQPNPILVDHGAGSAASQLPGSATEPCPFRPRVTLREKIAAGDEIIRRAGTEECEGEIILHISDRLKSLQQMAAE